MKHTSKILISLVLLFSTMAAYSQCETYLQKADDFFNQKKYQEAKSQYLNYKECKPAPPSIDEKISLCNCLLSGKSMNECGGTISVAPASNIDWVKLLKRDLVRREIKEQSDGYFGSSWSWRIDSPEEIKKVTIINEKKQGNDYVLDVLLLLQAKGSSEYEVNVKITYVLEQNNQWKIDFIENKNINIVKTGRYNNCITTEETNNSSNTNRYVKASIQFSNSCDVDLIIGGQVKGEDGKWRKFSCTVSKNATNNVPDGKEYKIDFIERGQDGYNGASYRFR